MATAVDSPAPTAPRRRAGLILLLIGLPVLGLVLGGVTGFALGAYPLNPLQSRLDATTQTLHKTSGTLHNTLKDLGDSVTSVAACKSAYLHEKEGASLLLSAATKTAEMGNSIQADVPLGYMPDSAAIQLKGDDAQNDVNAAQSEFSNASTDGCG